MRPLVAALVLTAGLAVPLAAQMTVDFTPELGAFVPLQNLLNGPPVTRHQTRFAIGGRVGLWLGPSFGLETTAAYSEPKVVTRVNGVNVDATDANIFAGSLRGVVKLGSADRGVALLLSAGAGLVSNGGAYGSGRSGHLKFAPAAGLGFLARLTRDVDARLDVDGYDYRPQLTDVDGVVTTYRRQYDLLIMLGLTGRFGGM